LPENLLPYTKPSETIDSDNEDIIKIANLLGRGEDDLYVVVYKLAEWTKNNVEYDLSTLTAEITQKASWVLTNKQGVCDELTSLFIALNRALGIPAKFVSGISYTNSELFTDQWGPHGWAEVYFPNYGWIPFDVTYGEFGFIDPTHIKLKESIDGKDTSTRYLWLGRNIDLETKKLDIKTTLLEKKGLINPFISLKLKPIKDATGFGSYNLIETEVKNLKNYYISTELYLSKPDEVKIIGDERIQILLKPEEKKKVYWTVKLSQNLNSNYIYTFPLAVYSLRNVSARASFGSTFDDPVFSLTEIKDILEQRQEEEKKVYSKEVNLKCDINKDEFYEYENALINCEIKNIGNILLENINICMEKECKKIDLGISQSKEINFSVMGDYIGKKEIKITAINSQVSKSKFVKYNVLDKPKIEIIDIEYPNNVSFEQEYSISFTLKKSSKSIPKKY
jgi:hypothetical protein